MQLTSPRTRYTELRPSAQDHTVTTSAPRESRFPPLYDISEIRPQNPAVSPLFNVTAAEDRHLTVLQTWVATTQKGKYPQILGSQSAPKPTNQPANLTPSPETVTRFYHFCFSACSDCRHHTQCEPKFQTKMTNNFYVPIVFLGI